MDLEKRDKAYELYIQSGRKMSTKEIAGILGVPEGTVKAWKSRGKWDKKVATKKATKKTQLQPELQRLHPKGGAPFGSKNALKNSGGKGATPTHGLYSKVITDEEREYLLMTERMTLEDELRLARARLARLIKAQQDKKFIGTFVVGFSVKKLPLEDDWYENAIQKAFTIISRLESSLKKNDLEQKKLDLLKRKIGEDDENEIVNNSFIEALSASSKEVWSDENDETE